jgi:hypothetical protein
MRSYQFAADVYGRKDLHSKLLADSAIGRSLFSRISLFRTNVE